MKLVYFSYPYTSDPKGNTEKIKEIVRKVLEKRDDIVPIIPHLVFDALYDFPSGYTLTGVAVLELEIISRCDLVAYVEGTLEKSTGVQWEMAFAKWLGVPIVEVGEL